MEREPIVGVLTMRAGMGEDTVLEGALSGGSLQYSHRSPE